MSGDATVHWLTANDRDFRGHAGSGDETRVVFDGAARTKDLADRFAAGRLESLRRGHAVVSFTVLGRPQLELGDAVQVSGLPAGESALGGYVRRIRHRFGETVGFVTDVAMQVTP
jgi:hypothetical protein